LWISNDYRLYRLAVEALRRSGGDARAAAGELVGSLPPATPDGVAYTRETLTAAMEGWS
jgi:hypothetical protein